MSEYEESIQWIIDNETPYLKKMQPKIWSDWNGNPHLISKMQTDHIEACCKKIKGDIERLRTRPDEIADKLIPLLESKYKELQNEIKKRLNSI